jgi:hypothetical protein
VRPRTGLDTFLGHVASSEEIEEVHLARSFRLIAVTGLFCAAALVIDLNAAGASPPDVRGVWKQLAGPVEGTQVSNVDPSCGFPPFLIRAEFDLQSTGGPPTGPTHIAVDMCSPIFGPSLFVGTFSLQTRLGDASGTARGSVVEVVPAGVRTIFTLTPTSGTGALTSNPVPLTLDLVWSAPAPGVVTPVEGTLSAGPSQPAS